VAGGFAWKAHFVNQSGALLTHGDAQYNLPNSFLNLPGQFAPYATGQETSDAFNCGACHATGYTSAGNQDGKPGLIGTWKEGGVGCEACHGPGSNHIGNPGSVPPPQNPAASCSNCHIRDSQTAIEAEDGLILHQQQAEEIEAGGKFYFTCTACHNAHASAHYDPQAPGSAIVQDCINCHTDKTVGLGMGFLKCADCHMPFAVKSGASISYKDPAGRDLKIGDMRSHVFTINTEAGGPAEMYSADGTSLAVGNDGRAEGLTLDFMCLSCHRTGGIANNAYTFEQVKGLAALVHNPPIVNNGYVGSALCIACHASSDKNIVDAYQDSGHHFALNAVHGAAPSYPVFAPGVPQPPATFQWADMLYVVGGYGWKAHFVNKTGYIITNGKDKIDSQYNLPNSFLGTAGQFVPYEETTSAANLFDCGSCHTTGYTKNGNQGGLPGIAGTWNEEGVGCEACHGPGEPHINNPQGVKPSADPKQSCSNCHIRDNTAVIEAEEGLILHQQQSEELAAGAKSFLTCSSCHNAHASAHNEQSAKGSGIVLECTACHPDKTIGLGMSFLKCVDCHMPYAVKSAASISYTDSDGKNFNLGDVRSHVFTINKDAAGPSDMFTADGAALATGTNGSVTGLTLDFMCLSCHRTGGIAKNAYTFEQVKAFAAIVH
jgi:hypothetical protein